MSAVEAWLGRMGTVQGGRPAAGSAFGIPVSIDYWLVATTTIR